MFTVSHNRNTKAKKTIQLGLRYHITEIHTQKNDPTLFTLSHNRNTQAKKNDPIVLTLSHNRNT